MTKYFCPECGYEGDEPICPHCNIPAESLEYNEEKLAKEESYSPEEIKEAGLEEVEEVIDKDLDEEI